MSEITAAAVLEEIRSTHEQFKTHVDKQIEEVRKGHSTAELDAKIVKIEADMVEQRTKYDDLVKAGNRPNVAGIGGADNAETELRKEAFTKFLRYGNGENGRSMMSSEEVRALAGTSDVDGGFLVPTAFETELIKNAYNDSEIRPVVQVGQTSRDSVQLGSISKPVVAWGAKGIAITEQQLSTGGERIEIFDLKALTLISNNTLEDSAANVWAELNDMFSMALAEAEDDAFAIGAGDKSPQGIFADARVQANFTKSGHATAVNSVDALITMLHSLKKTYRRNATWAMNSTTEGEVRKLKDSNGQYLWQPPVQAGGAPLLLGRPLINPEGAPDVAANSFPIALGDFRRGFKVRDRQGVTVQRLVERYAEYDQTGFIVKKRVGGQVVLPEAFAVLKVSA